MMSFIFDFVFFSFLFINFFFLLLFFFKSTKNQRERNITFVIIIIIFIHNGITIVSSFRHSFIHGFFSVVNRRQNRFVFQLFYSKLRNAVLITFHFQSHIVIYFQYAIHPTSTIRIRRVL